MGDFKYPYTDFHEMNTDWIIEQIPKIKESEEAAEAAQEAAEIAQVKAEDAQEAAETAQEKAEDAQQAAEDAQQAAEDAQEAAETAQGLAEDAVDDARDVVSSTVNQIDLIQARVDNIIPDGTQTVGNTELLDIRVSYDGVTYASAGDAVRNQVDLTANYINVTELLMGALTPNTILGSSVTPGDTADPFLTSDPVRWSFAPIEYFVNRDFIFVNKDTSNYTITIVTRDSSHAILGSTIRSATPYVKISKGTAKYFLVQFNASVTVDSSNVESCAENFEVWISKEDFDKNSDYPLIIGVAGVTASGTISWDMTRGVIAYPITAKYLYMENFSEKLNARMVLDDYAGNILLNTAWNIPYSEYTVPVLNNVFLTNFRNADNSRFTASDYETLNNLVIKKCDEEFIPPEIPNTAFIEKYAHRIERIVAPPNTLPACTLSYLNGFRFFEVDVQMTNDNVPVICHDITIDAISDGTGHVYDYTFAQIRAFDFGSWKSSLYAGTTILSLEELLKFAKMYDIKLNIEIKAYQTITQAQFDIIWDLILKYDMTKNIIWNEYGDTEYYIFAFISAKDSKQNLQWIYTDLNSYSINKASSLLNGDNEVSIEVPWSTLKTRTTEAAAAITAGLKLSTDMIGATDTITYNDYTDMINFGVSGIITENPIYEYWPRKNIVS